MMEAMIAPEPSVPPIPRAAFLKRQAAARASAADRGYAALLIVGRSFYDRPGDLAYLTNHFPPFPTTVFSEHNRGMGHAFLLLPVAGEPILLTDPRRHRADLVAIDDVRSAADLGAATIAALRERGLDRARVGLVGDDILPAAFDRTFRSELPALTLEAEREIVAGMRRIKSAGELALLREAARCADAGLQAALTVIAAEQPTERDVCATGIAAAMRAGCGFRSLFPGSLRSLVGSRFALAASDGPRHHRR